jgi:AbiV family abortive infection protein
MRDPDPIPRAALRQGILTCLSVASLRLQETDLLLPHGLLTQAAVLFSLAVEEFGKASLLRKAFESGQDPAVVKDFYDHHLKIAAAGAYLDANDLLLDNAGAFDVSVFDAATFDVGRQVDLSTRLSGLYVDWKDGNWKHGVHVDPEVLARSSRNVQLRISRATIEWT